MLCVVRKGSREPRTSASLVEWLTKHVPEDGKVLVNLRASQVAGFGLLSRDLGGDVAT